MLANVLYCVNLKSELQVLVVLFSTVYVLSTDQQGTGRDVHAIRSKERHVTGPCNQKKRIEF